MSCFCLNACQQPCDMVSGLYIPLRCIFALRESGNNNHSVWTAGFSRKHLKHKPYLRHRQLSMHSTNFSSLSLDCHKWVTKKSPRKVMFLARICNPYVWLYFSHVHWCYRLRHSVTLCSIILSRLLDYFRGFCPETLSVEFDFWPSDSW